MNPDIITNGLKRLIAEYLKSSFEEVKYSPGWYKFTPEDLDAIEAYTKIIISNLEESIE